MKITRRDFLKATMAGAVSLSAASLLSGCEGITEGLPFSDPAKQDVKTLTKAGFTVDEQSVEIAGLQKEYRLVFLNDLHLLIPNEEVSEEAMPTVMDRYEKGHIDANGTKAYVLWDTLYETTENVRKMLDLLYAEDSPVAAVFGGHLHFTNDIMLTEKIRQHVFDAAFRGVIGYVVVKGA